jgi:hydroxyacylglutathione hydrolase
MIFERIEVPGLSHYSYILGCPADGRMVVVDPKRDVDDYLRFAQRKGLDISHVLETHIHADYASGACELAERVGASVWCSGYDEGETFEVQFPHTDVFDGDELILGSVRIIALHTPGHTPEHVSYLVYDLARSDSAPMAMLSGDFLFVGSLGRPDLLGEEAKLNLAKQLFHSVREKLRDLPDGLEIHPAHGAGSMCGAGMSGRPFSTLGYERIANPYLDPTLSEQQFIERILGSVPPFPEYYKRMKRVNSDGARVLGGIPGQSAIPPDRFAQLIEEGHIVIDLRDQIAFAGGHIPGSFGIGCGSLLPVWAAWVVPYDTPILLVANEASEAKEAARSLIRVGLDEIAGCLDGGIAAWTKAGLPLEQTGSATPDEIHKRLRRGEDVHVLDVRTDAEWNSGHIEGAMHLFGGEIENNLDRLPNKNATIAVTCGGGYRSTVAVSVLRRHGFRNLINIAGGMRAWKKDGLPTISERETVEV